MAYNKNELVRKIQSLQELSNEEKSALLELLRTHKKYGLVWEDKPEEVEERLRSELPVLKEVKERAIISDDPDAPNHILIEGDNLEALVALTYTHAGKIDVIYIDPPYNTGKKDFKYNDSYVDAEDSFRHSLWLSFIARRLRIAKQLLSEKGVIFISIGDDEVGNLKLLADSIFLEKNFIEMYLWESTFRPDNSSPILRRNAEFVLCYANNKANIASFKGVVSRTEGMPSLTKGKETVKTISFPPHSVHTLLPDGVYHKGVKDNGQELSWELVEDAEVKDGVFITEVVLRGHSYWSTQKKILNELSSGTEIWIKSESFVPYYKKAKASINRPTKILDPEIVNDYLYANAEVSGLIEKGAFNNPKPTTLIKFLTDFTDNPQANVLDFFAGSGTTLHAIMNLNAEDGGHRKCILVTNNENNICEEITYNRCKKVIHGYTNGKGAHVDGLTNNCLRYYKTEFISRERTSKSMRDLMNASTELLCIKNDLYSEVQSLSGKKLNSKLARYFDDGKKRMLVIYQEEAIPAIAELIAAMNYPGKMMVYVFSPGNYPYEDEFVDVLYKVELCALPAAIYNAYRKVLPKKKVVKLPEAEEDDRNTEGFDPEQEVTEGAAEQLNLNFGE